MMCSKLYKYITPPHWLIFGLPKDATRQVGWVSGCAMMIPKSLYEGVGGLNETMGFYGEEPEFGYRTWNKYHLKTLYYHDAEIIHLGGVSSKKTNRTPDEVRLRRYAALQRETVGYNRSIWMSRIVLGFAYIKRAISSNKLCFTEAIEWEKKVIAYLKKQKKTKE